MTPHLLAYALSTPWAMMPERMSAYAAVLAQHYAGTLPRRAPLAQAMEAGTEPQAATRAKSVKAGPGGIAVIGVSGAMVEWPNQIDMCDGGTSTRDLAAALRQCKLDDTVGQVALVFSTPGGSVYGMAEFADVINDVKSVKPVIGIAQSLAASAGYWALSQCTEAYCAPGGEVGSIGVYSAHENIAKALEMAGVEIKLFSAGKYKTEGHPFGPASEEFAAFQTQRANEYMTMFTKAVAKGRGAPIDQVRGGMGEGRCLGADAALAAGMVDGIACLDEVLLKMQRNAKNVAPVRGGRASLLAAKVALAGA